jgi:branched-chain amino acid transport system substrate-binding protein
MTKASWAIVVAAIGLAAGAIGIATHTPEPKSIRIGYAISLTGANADGAGTSALSNYRLWAAEVNGAGGIMLNSISKRVPVEIIEYDDESSAERAMRAVQRLIEQDKVDFLLPPWGTGLNLAVGALFHRAGYPHLAVTATTDRIAALAQQWPNSFWFQPTSTEIAQALAATLIKLRSEGKLGNRVAMVGVADQLGIGLAKAERHALQKASFEIVYERTYTVGDLDFRVLVNEAKDVNPDAFIAFSYPPDAIALTEQARAAALNPDVYYAGIGIAYPLYKYRFGADAEGVMGRGGWTVNTPERKDYVARYRAAFGEEPDRGGGPLTYTSLQVLRQAIEQVGRIDRAAVAEAIRTGVFQTIEGDISMKDSRYMGASLIGQWQNGEFQTIAPLTLPAAREPLSPKPAWRTVPTN